MRTGLTRKQKTTVIYFDEHSRIIEVQTHNTDLKKRLTAFAVFCQVKIPGFAKANSLVLPREIPGNCQINSLVLPRYFTRMRALRRR